MTGIQDQFQSDRESHIRAGTLSISEAEELNRLRAFFWEPDSNGAARWKRVRELFKLASGCRERWLQGELCLAGYGADSFDLGGGKADFCYPALMDKITPKLVPYPADLKPDACFPYDPPFVVGELKAIGTRGFSFKGSGQAQLKTLDGGGVLGLDGRGERPWGLLEDYHRLRESKYLGFRILVLVIAIDGPPEKWNVWGKLATHPNLNFHEALPLPNLVKEKSLWVRAWKVLPRNPAHSQPEFGEH